MALGLFAIWLVTWNGCSPSMRYDCGFTGRKAIPTNLHFVLRAPQNLASCRTRSCAELDPQARADTCRAGYRYLGRPCAQAMADHCVEARLAWIVRTPGELCHRHRTRDQR